MLCLAADQKGPAKGEDSDPLVKLEATVYLDKVSISKAIGDIMPEGVVVVDVKLIPAVGKKVKVTRDDFLLRSDKDGQKSNPFLPSQIAGSATLTVSTDYSGGAVMQQRRGPVWGGMGGGMPSQLPGSGTPTIGNSESQGEAVAKVDNPADGKPGESSLLKALKSKILEEKEIAAPHSGQLYFLLDGKHKVKDLELVYKTVTGRLYIRFK